MTLVNVKLAEGGFTEKQQRDMAVRLTDVIVAFEGSEASCEVVWVPPWPARRWDGCW